MQKGTRVLLCLTGILILLAGLARQIESVVAQNEQPLQSAGLLVRFRSGLAHERAQNFFASRGLHVRRRIPRIDVWEIDASASSVSMLADLKSDPDVLWAEPNGRVHAADVSPNDSFYQTRQWNLQQVGLPQAWGLVTGTAQLIAVIDTGVDLDHPDLVAKIWISPEVPSNGLDDDGNGYVDDVHGWDFVHDDNEPQDDRGHGSHVAGIAAARTNNGIGIAGVSWGAVIMPLKALNSQGDGTWADLAAAIVYAADNGARVINMSLGSSEHSQTVQAAVEYASSQGSLLIASAGNSGVLGVEYPAALPGVMAVAATTPQDTRWSLGSYGPEVDIAAPGEDIFSLSYAGSYFESSGTSMAAAHVSGLAALIWSVRPALSAAEVKQIIGETACDVSSPGWDAYTGWGRIDAFRAVQQARPRCYLPIVFVH